MHNFRSQSYEFKYWLHCFWYFQQNAFSKFSVLHCWRSACNSGCVATFFINLDLGKYIGRVALVTGKLSIIRKSRRSSIMNCSPTLPRLTAAYFIYCEDAQEFNIMILTCKEIPHSLENHRKGHWNLTYYKLSIPMQTSETYGKVI